MNSPAELEMLLRLMSDTISDLSGAVESLVKQVDAGNKRVTALSEELALSTAASKAGLEVVSRSLADTQTTASAAAATAEAARAYAVEAEAGVLGRLDGVCASYATLEHVEAQGVVLRTVTADEAARLSGMVEAVNATASEIGERVESVATELRGADAKLHKEFDDALLSLSTEVLDGVSKMQEASASVLQKAATAEEVEALREECVKLVAGAKLVVERRIDGVTERVDGVREDMAAMSVAVVAVKEAVANLPAPLQLPEFAAPADVLELQATVGDMAERLDALTVKVAEAPAPASIDTTEVHAMVKAAVAEATPPAPEGNMGLTYKGVYLVKSKYKLNEAVTHSGSIWQALKDNPGKPGETIGDWKLIVKCGANGKDGKDGASGPVYHDAFPAGGKVKAGDMLYHNRRIWLARKNCATPPEDAQATSSDKWALMALVG